ncbi:CCDC175 [Cervus elaphus hippelaphus]|uniref:CCDC175 n=1 Tax=Cervus elaphus hippelaphus TaxID=46360 RepID=A0A212CT75_CEREH|nr:CCDC175 [Cervus elaphus hippelaphus]
MRKNSKMALSAWSPELGLGSEKALPVAAVSTGPSLELCTFPSTLGSSVAADALEQLLVVGERPVGSRRDIFWKVVLKQHEAETLEGTFSSSLWERWVLSDHNLELARLQGSIRQWEEKVEDMKKSCKILEDKMLFFKNNKEKLDDSSNSEKSELLLKIKQMAEKLHKCHLDNKALREKLQTVSRQYKIVLNEEDKVFMQKRRIYSEYMAEKLHKCHLDNKALREKLQTVSRQYKIVLNEEDKVFMQKRRIYSENQKQLAFIAQKENFLSKRKVDIKNMEEGLITLGELHRATKEIYRKQIKILNENMERETQRCIIAQWKIACLRKKHARWIKNIKDEIKELIDKIQEAENRRNELIEETNIRQHDINEFVAQIEQLTLELKQEEDEFVIKEQKLIQELSKFEQRFAEEAQISKEKEVELVECLPQLQVAEEEFTYKNRKFENLIETVIVDFMFEQKKLKQELKQLREHESYKTKAHFETVKSLENEIYLHDLKTDALILENERLKEDTIEQYKRGEEDLMRSSSDLSCQLTDLQTQYSDLWAEFWTTLKELVESANEILREIKNLIDKLCERDEKIEQISILLQSDLEEMRSLMEQESETNFLSK